VLERQFSSELNFERQRTESISARQLPDLHDELICFWLREDQFATNGEEVVAFGQLILSPLGIGSVGI
jgi:hypothetical protein